MMPCPSTPCGSAKPRRLYQWQATRARRSPPAHFGQPIVGIIFNPGRVFIDLATPKICGTFCLGSTAIGGEFHLIAIGVGIIKRSGHAVVDGPIRRDRLRLGSYNLPFGTTWLAKRSAGRAVRQQLRWCAGSGCAPAGAPAAAGATSPAQWWPDRSGPVENCPSHPSPRPCPLKQTVQQARLTWGQS